MRHPLVGGALASLLVLASAGALVAHHAASSGGRTPVAGRPSASSMGTSTPTVTISASPSATPNPTPPPVSAPVHFSTLPPGSALPSDAQCAAWVRARPVAENKRENRGFNQVTGQSLGATFFPRSDDPRANRLIAPRVDGQFTGTTHQVLRWAACKWGVDEDIVAAQAVQESSWNQATEGDWRSDASACAPGHGLGADGRSGQCPQSWGIIQNRYPFEQPSWPGIRSSTAMNADTAYAVWRACFEGYEVWLNQVERGRQYAAGDAWGCIGRWFAGRWHTADAERYIANVKGILSQRTWQQPGFQEP
jgi:autotransporter family porin